MIKMKSEKKIAKRGKQKQKQRMFSLYIDLKKGKTKCI
jgi:hypothetical protein